MDTNSLIHLIETVSKTLNAEGFEHIDLSHEGTTLTLNKKSVASVISGSQVAVQPAAPVFAAAPSQNEFLTCLKNRKVDWSRINAFHMDEYIGLDKDAPQLFGNYLKEMLFDKVPFREIYYLNGDINRKEEECSRYSELLQQYPTDIVILGIGENTHIAFNDPHVADFKDPKAVKIVDLDERNRLQQVDPADKICFNSIEEVPTHAILLRTERPEQDPRSTCPA